MIYNLARVEDPFLFFTVYVVIIIPFSSVRTRKSIHLHRTQKLKNFVETSIITSQ